MPREVTHQDQSVIDAVRRVVLDEARVRIAPAELSLEEPLNGDLLKVTSFGFLGMLMRLEDEVGQELPDDLFVGRTFHTVGDLVDVVAMAGGGPS